MSGAEDVPFTGEIPEHLKGVIASANRALDSGWEIYWNWDCRKCNANQTFENMGKLHATGICEECGHTSDLFDPSTKVSYVAISVLGGG